MHPYRIWVRIAIGVKLNVHAEIAAQTCKRLWVEGHVHRHDVAVGADGDKYRLAIAALELEPKLRVRGRRRPFTRYRSGNPVLVSRVPELPDAIPERALDGKVIEFAVHELVCFVLDAKGCAGIVHV